MFVIKFDLKYQQKLDFLLQKKNLINKRKFISNLINSTMIKHNIKTI